MYEYIIGEIKAIKEKSIILESNKIGYIINVGDSKLYKVNENNKVYIYQSVKEDSLDLYGFKTVEDKDLFLLLLSVKGIGPKSALAASTSISLSLLQQAITKNDIKYLSSFPGIGPKAAQQIIIDLKGKIKLDLFVENDNSMDALQALVSLGYTKNVVLKTFNEIDTSSDVQTIIKESLRLMNGVR